MQPNHKNKLRLNQLKSIFCHNIQSHYFFTKRTKLLQLHEYDDLEFRKCEKYLKLRVFQAFDLEEIIKKKFLKQIRL